MHIQPIIDSALKGGEVLRGYFGQALETTQKSSLADFRTKADLESEQAIIDYLTRHFPDFNILSEERGRLDRGSDYTFVIDPLDGTCNFVLGIPNFSISIALFQGRTLIAGVIHAPILSQTYHAQKTRGAYRNGERIQVSGVTEVSQSMVAQTCSYLTPDEEITSTIVRAHAKDVKRIMTNWSPAFDYCLLASGKIEGMINHGAELYDFSAGKLIAAEAGAVITGYNGLPTVDDHEPFFVASNCRALHSTFLEIARG